MFSKKFRKNIPIYIIASYIFFIGLSYILFVLLGLKNHDIARTVGSPTQSVLLGIGLIYLSSSLLKRLFRAWLITFSLVCLATLRELLILPKTLDLTNVALLVIAGCSLYLLRRQFVAQAETMRLRSGFLVASFMLVIAVVYGTLGFHFLPDRETGRKYSFTEGLEATMTEFSLSNRDQTMASHIRRVETFLLSLRALGVASFLLAGYSLLQPLIYRREHSSSAIETARQLLERYGGGSEDFFKLWPEDKEYIFTSNQEAAVAYKVRRGVALGAGDPFGKHTSLDDAISTFQTFCHKHSFDMTFVHVTNKHQKLYEKHQLVMQKIGEEAVIDLKTFAEVTAVNKKWRHVKNKFDKLGYEFELRPAPLSPTLLDELKRVSDDWLETPGRIERGFFMGYFDPAYIGNCTVGILRNDEKQIVSFVNLIESFDPDEANIDLFRQRQGSPTNMNDYMIHQTLLAMHRQGFARFNLGLCPLVGLDDAAENGPISRALGLVYNYGGKFYSFKGLYQFKSKFEPEWRDRYIAYEPGALTIVKAAQALSAAMKVK